MAKVLELLGNSLDVSDPKGTLEVNARKLKVGERLIATYKKSDGLFAPDEIKSDGDKLELAIEGDQVVALLKDAGTYQINAGERTVTIEVVSE